MVRPSRFAFVGVVLVGWLIPQGARAQSSIEIPRLPPASALTAHRVWDSCRAVIAADERLRSAGVITAAAPTFDANAWETARARVVNDAPALVDPAQLTTLLSPAAEQLGALGAACGAVIQGGALTPSYLRSLEALVAKPELAWLDAQTASLTSAPLDGPRVAAAFTPTPPTSPPNTATPTAPDPAQPSTPEPPAPLQTTAPSVAEVLLDEAQRKLVREAMSALLKGACDPAHYRPYFEATCGTLESLSSATELQKFPEQLHQSAQQDLARLPLVMVSRADRLDDTAVTLWIVAVLLRDGLEHGDWPGLVRGLSALECHGVAQASCERGTPQALRRLGQLTVALERHARGFPDALDAERLRVIALLVALELTPSGALETIERTQQQVQALASGWEALQAAATPVTAAAAQAAAGVAAATPASLTAAASTPSAAALDVTLEYLLGYVTAQASAATGLDPAQLRSLKTCVVSARQGNLSLSLSEATTLAAKSSLPLPDEVRALLTVIETLRGKASAGELLEALAQSPWLTQQLTEQLRGRALKRGYDPLGDAPRKRPDDNGAPREGIARYLGGVRAGYVYQHWKPQDIPDVHYRTVGLNLLRLELLLNTDDVPALELLEGYFRYEFAPGGQAEQDELIQLYEREASGWQTILGEVAANLPTFSDERHLRGPAFGFTRRYFLASAQALKDYWYYDERSVALLAPGDTIRTNTVMTVYTLGFRETQLVNQQPNWGWEAGGFYLDYRKPYTHSRFTNVDRAAIFDATFRGMGAYATGRWFIPSDNPAAPGQLSLNAKFGRADILLDDIVASEVLPGNSGVFMFEATAEVQLPVFWWGGFFAGGMGHATYRNFGDYFSGGESDTSRVNDQSLNDDFILGITAQLGYLL